MIIARHGEIYTKSMPVRQRFRERLVKNIRNQLPEAKVDYKRWRIFVWHDNEREAISQLSKIFGLTSVSACHDVPADIPSINEVLERYTNDVKRASTFAVKVQRITKEFGMTSQEIAREVGGRLQDNTGTRVDLKHPEFQINIEIYDGRAYIFTKTISCVGGLPVGTGGTILAIVKNKQDVLAALLMMKRGLLPVFFVESHEYDDIIKRYSNGHVLSIRPFQSIDALVSFDEKAIVVGTMDVTELRALRKKTKKLILTPLLGLPKQRQDALALPI